MIWDESRRKAHAEAMRKLSKDPKWLKAMKKLSKDPKWRKANAEMLEQARFPRICVTDDGEYAGSEAEATLDALLRFFGARFKHHPGKVLTKAGYYLPDFTLFEDVPILGLKHGLLELKDGQYYNGNVRRARMAGACVVQASFLWKRIGAARVVGRSEATPVPTMARHSAPDAQDECTP